MTNRPKLRIDLEVSEVQEKNQDKSLILKDPVGNKFYRLSQYEYILLSSLDGTVTLEEALEKLKYDGFYYSKEDAAAIMGKAAQAGLLLGSKYGTSEFQNIMKKKIQKAELEASISRVYFLFIPLVNPDRFLEKTVWLYRKLLNRWTAFIGVSLIPGAVYLIITDLWKSEQEYLFFFRLENLIYLWITIALTKLVHELAHAYTAKNYGLRVPQMGLAFLIFFPCMYCNMTDAWRLADHRQRMAISAAGILAEAGLAVLATYMYHFTRPGVMHSLFYYLVAVSLISTILFNANPLLKFDGYFILTDLLNIPNLATKAKSYLKYLVMNRAFGISLFANSARSPKDGFIYGVYGASSLIYRFFLYLRIIQGVYFRFNKLLGITLAVLAFGVFVVKPLKNQVETFSRLRNEIHPQPVGVLMLLMVAAVIVVPLTIPISTQTVYSCYLDSANVQKITIPLGASVRKVFVRDKTTIESGTLLFQLDSTELAKALAQKECERDIVRLKIKMSLLDEKDLAKASEQRIQLAQVEHEIRLLTQDLNKAENGIVAPFDGVLTRLDPAVQEGFQTVGGAVVGELKSHRDCVVNILIPEKDIDSVELGQRISIWFGSGSGTVFPGKIMEIKSFSESDLKDSPFSSRHGGEIATEMKDHQHLDAPLEAHYIASTTFQNDDLMPLMITGKCAVSTAPRSILTRLRNRAVQTFNRETLL